MSQNSNILMFLQEGNTLTKAEAFSRGWGLSLNSRCAELRRTTGADIQCELVSINGKKVWQYYIPLHVAYG